MLDRLAADVRPASDRRARQRDTQRTRIVDAARRLFTRRGVDDVTMTEVAAEAGGVASAFDSLVNGTITHWLYGDAAEPLRQRMRRAAEVFLGAVALAPAAHRSALLPALAPRRRRTSAPRRQRHPPGRRVS